MLQWGTNERIVSDAEDRDDFCVHLDREEGSRTVRLVDFCLRDELTLDVRSQDFVQMDAISYPVTIGTVITNQNSTE